MILRRVTGDDARLPEDVTVGIVVASILLGDVNVDIGSPVALTLVGVGVALGFVGELDIARLLVRDGVLDSAYQRVDIDAPTVVAARDGDLFAVGARVGALRPDGVVVVGELVRPVREALVAERGVERVVEGDPVLKGGAVELAGVVAVELEGHVHTEEVVRGVAGGLDLVIGEAVVERRVGVITELGEVCRARKRRELHLGVLDDVVAAELLHGLGLGEGELALVGVEGLRCAEGAGAALVELVDGLAELGLEFVFFKGGGEERRVDILAEVDCSVGGGAVGGAEVLHELDGPCERGLGRDFLAGGRFAIDERLVRLGLVSPLKSVAGHVETVARPRRIDLGCGG